MSHFQINRRQRVGSRGCAPLLASDSPQLRIESRKRRHPSRLSTSSYGRRHGQQAWQAAQVYREHGQREHIADFAATTQLDLADGAAVLLAVAKQSLDHLANDLAECVPGMPGGAPIDTAPAAGTLASLGVVLVGVLRYMRGDVDLATRGDEFGGVEFLIGANRHWL